MVWSVSKGKMFNQCQRKWLYYEIVASATSSDPIRKEAYYLKQAQSIAAWRGRIVDIVISDKIAPFLRNNQVPEKDQVFSFAENLIESQLEFGKEKRYRENGVTKSSAGNCFCAFYDIEYSNGLDNSSLESAKHEVKQALFNLLDSNFIQRIANENEYLISQRSLRFKLMDEHNITCTPDMIVFFEDQPPLIIDWKVHAFGNSDAWLQLGIYSLALSRAKPHKDFPESFRSYADRPDSFRLLEYQLLKNVQRNYSLKKEDVLDIEDHIFRSSSQMNLLIKGKKLEDLDFSVFKTTRRPQICSRCQFKKLCWDKVSDSRPKPMQQTLFGVFK